MAKKRGQNEGSVRKRSDGTWEARVTIGTLPNGKPHRKSLYGRTRSEVAAKMNDLQNTLQKGLITNPTEMAVGEWLDYYMVEYKKRTVKPTTYINYSVKVKNHIKPEIGRYKLKSLRQNEVQKFINALSDKGLAPATVISTYKLFHGALETAQNDGLIVRNVADQVKLPKLVKAPIEVLTQEQQDLFVEKAKETYMGCIFILGLCTGMRKGELIGLKWGDIDYEGKQLHVRRTINVVKDLDNPQGKWYLGFGTPKTEASKRSIPLHETAIRVLKDIKAQQDAYKKKFGVAYEDNDLVFSTQQGRPLDPRNMGRTFKKVCNKAGLTDFHIHCLRHSFATRGLENGVDICVMQKYLGHATMKETADTYTHVLADLKINEMQKLEGAVKY
ncbi:MAG: site-specific integrase [Clostridia bacterium]|nr:site-specific integrase [Clostridia bacterium]